MSKTLTSKALWSGGNIVLTAFLSILLSSILDLELRRTRLLTVFIKPFSIGILHELFELPCDIRFHLRIFIIRRLINITTFDLQCHTFALAWFPDPGQTQFIGLQVANQLCQRNLVNVLWFLNGGDLGVESLQKRYEHLYYNLAFWNGFPKIKCKVHYVLQLGIELIKWLTLLHLNFFKACCKSLKLWILDSLSPFKGCLEDSPCFLCNFSRGYLLEFLICDRTE